MMEGFVIGAGLGLAVYLVYVVPGLVRAVRYDWKHRHGVPEWAQKGWLWWLR